MAPPSVALPPALPCELLSYVLTHQIYPTTLIICQPRAAFLSSLLASIPQSPQRQAPPPSGQDSPAASPSDGPQIDLELEPEPKSLYHLLIPTIHQVATSRHVSLVFTPTLSHLRAYLSVFPPLNTDEGPRERTFDQSGKKFPLLIVYGLVELHKNTSEWSAQGLMHSIAELVEAGWRAARKIVVLEKREMNPNPGGEHQMHGASVKEGKKIWEDRVPMLTGSVRRAGLESEDGGWSGRTMEVGKVLSRWFVSGRGDWESKTRDC